MSYEEQIMSKDKYPSLCSRQMAATVFFVRMKIRLKEIFEGKKSSPTGGNLQNSPNSTGKGKLCRPEKSLIRQNIIPVSVA